MRALTHLLDRAPVLTSAAADLKRRTWTFATPQGLSVAAGDFALVPVAALREAVSMDAALVCVQLQHDHSPRYVRFSERGDGYRTYDVTSEGGGYGAHVQTSRHHDQHPEMRNRWYGSEFMLDARGRKWERSFGFMVMDDFGNLVEVPE